MPLQNLNTASPSNAAEFMVSGIPFFQRGSVGATAEKVEFSHVTQRVKIVNDGGNDLLVAATENGLTGANHYRVLATNGVPYDMDVRVGAIWIQGDGGSTDYQITAQLTTVRTDLPAAESVLAISASNGWPGVG